jgi:4-hydroxy-tetrahydrodipicolinate synthase
MIASGRKPAGFIPAPLLPLTQAGSVDFGLLEKQVDYLIKAGADGLFINGTTGEGAWLATSEKTDVLRAAKQAAAGRCFLAAACLQPATPQVLAEMEAMLKLEPDFVVAVAPYYYAVSQQALAAHFREVARASPVPLILYNIPQCTHNPISVETVLELAWEPNVAGIKDSSGDFVSFCRGLAAGAKPGVLDGAKAGARDGAPAGFSWIMGEDYLDGPAMLSGADGIVSGLANVWAGFHAALVRAAQAGDREGVLANQAKVHQLYGIHRVTGGKVIQVLKAGAAMFGRSTPRMRLPSLDLGEEDTAAVRRVLEGLGLL